MHWDPGSAGWGAGAGLTAGVFLRKAGLIECDTAPAVCARLLTIEIFLTMNPDSTMPCFNEPIRAMTLGKMHGRRPVGVA